MAEEKIKKIDIITRPSKFEELKGSLNYIGVSGMTVSQVSGCGQQKGWYEKYRGQDKDINLLPKIKVEVVVCERLVEKVIETAKKVLQTGFVGDGKIFIYNVKSVIRIRTNEKNKDAL